ncbi:MAG: hypothetical protein JWL88_133 [Parcubacteria group bacterium]|nr:hypothetical protein [Parcubacteria group bacterium]
MPSIYLITGVNGVGKSSIIPYLAEELSDKDFAIHDFDERGVPDSAGKEWRETELNYWLSVGEANAEKEVSTIICGYMKPEEIHSASLEVKVILLDADAETIASRVLSRYETPESLTELERTTGKTPEEFAASNVWVSAKFRELSNEYGYMIIDTSHLTPEAVASEIVARL